MFANARNGFWIAGAVAAVLYLLSPKIAAAGWAEADKHDAVNAYVGQGTNRPGRSLAGEVLLDGGFLPEVKIASGPTSPTYVELVDAYGNPAGTALYPVKTQPIDYPVLGRRSDQCLSATWTVRGDGGLQGKLAAADGGVPVTGIRYWCTATADGCFKQGSGQPQGCAFAAMFFASGTSSEVFFAEPDGGAPAVYGLGLTGTTQFDCCPND